MSQSMERRLGFSEILRLRLHLVICVWCARYLRQIKLLRRVARSGSGIDQPDNSLTTTLSAEVRARIANSLGQGSSTDCTDFTERK